MKSCHTQLVINAPVALVWNILTDVERYPEWNPSIAKVWGSLREQGIIYIHHAHLHLIIPVRIERLQPRAQLAWRGIKTFSAVVQGEHYFRLTDLGDDRTELQHGEIFSGWLSHLLPSSFFSKLQSNYAYHNQKLKIISEQQHQLAVL
jgi:hypothetical protein